MKKIYPSLIASKILELKEQIKMLEDYCDGFHIDVMDMHFVPNLTMGPDFINEIKKITNKPLWIHLMVDNPKQWLNILKLKENDIFCFHYECVSQFAPASPAKLQAKHGSKVEGKNIIDDIKFKELLASIAINPETEIKEILNLLPLIDQVLIMSVKPGFQGQKFIPETINKIKELNEYKKQHNLNFEIAVDGGINQNNILELSNLGVNDFAIGSAIFDKENSINELEKFYNIIKKVHRDS